MIPDMIQRRLAGWTPPEQRADRVVRAGDVRRAESGGEERLVMVLKVNSGRGDAQITLVHSYPEYATESDIVVDRSVTGLSYPVVVQTGLRGVARLMDLGRLICDLPDEVVTACLSCRTTAIASSGMWVGSRLTGPLDSRWEFKNGERISLSRISAYDARTTDN